MSLYPVLSAKNAVRTVRGSAFVLGLVLCLFMGAAAASEPPAPESLTLKETVRHGLENNPNLRAAEYEIKKSESRIGQATSRFLPSLTTSWQQQKVESISAEGPTETDYLDQDYSSFSIQLVQPLFAGLANISSYDKAKLQKLVSREEKKRIELQLILDIQSNFLKLLKAREDVRTLEETVRRLKVNVQSAKAYQEQEMIPYYQVLQAEVELADAEQELSQAGNSMQKLGFTLNSLLDIPVRSDVNYLGRLADFDRDFSYSYEQALNQALQNRPELESARLQVEMVLEQLDVERGAFFPRLDLVGGYNISDRDYSETGTDIYGQTSDRDQENEYWTVGIRLNWDLFAGGEKIHRYQEFQHEWQKMKSKLRDIENQIHNQVRSSHISFQEARGRILSTRKAVEAAREGYERAEKNMELGLGTIPELLDAQDRLRRAEGNWNKARGDQLLAKAQLYFSMGIPNTDLNSQLPEE